MKLRYSIAVACALLALALACLRPGPESRTLAGLAAMLERASGVAVLPTDICWEPTPGLLTEVAWGRPILFLGSQGGTRDVYRARVRLSLEGAPIAVSTLRNLTATSAGDEQSLACKGNLAAFVTGAYGKIESGTLLSLEGSFVSDLTWGERLMAAVSNYQEVGDTRGIGRVELAFEHPALRVALQWMPGTLALSLDDGATLRFDLASLSGPGMQASALPVLQKRPILWLVDTVRAEVGPEPIAWMEAQVFGVRDTVRRGLFRWQAASPAEADRQPEETRPPPPAPQEAENPGVEAVAWPPATIASLVSSAPEGEGQWEPVTYPWLRTEGASAQPGYAYFYQATIHPDRDRPYAKVRLVAMDMRRLDLDMEGGVEDPKPLTGAHGAGRIPRDPRVLNRVVGAFNGAFKTTHGEYGMMVQRRVLLPPKPGAATLLVTEDRRVLLGTWGASTSISNEIVSFRQNLEPLVEDGQLAPSGRKQWGWQLDGTSMFTERSGVCLHRDGYLIYVWGDELSGATLGKAMLQAGCTYGMHLDMNPHHTGFVFASVRGPKDFDAKLLTSEMSINPDRYLQYSPKDFFYVMLREPSPESTLSWAPDVGTQPDPPEAPAIARAFVPSDSSVQVDLTSFALARVRGSFRVNGHGTRDGGEGASSGPLLAGFTTGQSRDSSHSLGLSLGGQPTFAPVPGVPMVAVTSDGVVRLIPGGPPPGAEWMQLPAIVQEGKVTDAAQERGALRKRGALGVSPSGHLILARATALSDGPLASALARVGCTLAVTLDRGNHAPVASFRAGGGTGALPLDAMALMLRAGTPTGRWRIDPDPAEPARIPGVVSTSARRSR